MALSNAHYSESAPDWIAYQNDPSNNIEAKSDDVETIQTSSDLVARRNGFEEMSKQWAAKFPVTRFAYAAHHETIKTRDGHFIDITIYRPSKLAEPSAKLPLLFIILAVAGYLAISMQRNGFSYGPLWRITSA